VPPDVGSKIILNWILREMARVGMDCINLALDRDQRRALVNTVINLSNWWLLKKNSLKLRVLFGTIGTTN
jgi:hypothetical protein